MLIADECETLGFDYNDTENDAAQEDADVDFSFNEVCKGNSYGLHTDC